MAAVVDEACRDLEQVAAAKVLAEARRNLFDGVAEKDVGTALVMAARVQIEQEPNYSQVTARLLMDNLRREALSFLAGLPQEATQAEMGERYPEYFHAYIKRAAQLELVDSELTRYDLEALGKALKPERDLQFTYLGLQTLYDRYFIHSGGVRFELPQAFFMRVAMGLAINEVDREARAVEFYELLSSFDFMSSTPTLFNSGTLRPQLSSCYLTTVPDDLEGIFGAIKDNALLSKFAGGLGNDWTRVRGMGAYIKGTNGKSQGVVPFLKVANDTAVAVNQGGKRKGAVCAYLETWHIDVEEFIELRKNTGDDRRRTHDMNTANWIPDLFMQRVVEEGDWTLFSPSETGDLHDLVGSAFAKRYAEYEAKAARGEIKVFKKIKAVDLWRKMLAMLFETGHPWMTFKDPCNLRSPQGHVGVVHSSNLCTEITLNTSDDEIAVCNLGSVNLAAHVKDGALDLPKLERTVTTAMRMLDNVIDYNYYSVPQARRSNLRHRPVGLGIMGFQDALYAMRQPYASEDAVTFADTSMEAVSYFAIQASTQLAEERGRYATYEGSLWSQGILPIDSIDRLGEVRGQYLQQDTSRTLDWDGLRERGEDRRHAQLQHHGHRAHCHHLQHLRRVAEHRADLPEPFRQIEPVGRVHRDQPLPGPRPEGTRSLGRGDGQRPEVLRRLGAAAGPRAGGPEGALRHRVRARHPLAGGGRLAPPEVDRPGPEPEPVHGRTLRQEARQPLQARLGAWPKDDLLPALHGRHACREEHRHRHRAGQQAQRRERQRQRPCHRVIGPKSLLHPRPRLRGLPVTHHQTVIASPAGARQATPPPGSRRAFAPRDDGQDSNVATNESRRTRPC
jgi:ribonucleoside-diphosphate reductase alpha chain